MTQRHSTGDLTPLSGKFEKENVAFILSEYLALNYSTVTTRFECRQALFFVMTRKFVYAWMEWYGEGERSAYIAWRISGESMNDPQRINMALEKIKKMSTSRHISVLIQALRLAIDPIEVSDQDGVLESIADILDPK